MMLAAGFGVLAVLLAAIGIYGVVSYSVSRRTREIGIRVALGATRTEVGRLMIREGLQMTALGIVFGVGAALALSRVLRSLLYEVRPGDPFTYVAVCAMLIAVALLGPPLAGLAVIESQALLYNTSIAFRTKCIDGITVNEKTLAHYMETTVGIVTALNPLLGYEKATELAGEAYKSGKGILEIIREKKILTEQQIAALLDPVKLTGLDRKQYGKR